MRRSIKAGYLEGKAEVGEGCGRLLFGASDVMRRDLYGIAAVLAVLLLTLAYRETYMEPRAWGVLCARAPPPAACIPRAALGWMQQWQLWGAAALVLGGWAFLLRAPFAVRVAAVAVGAVAVANYNATWGMLGAALGAWAWIRPEPRPGRAGGA